MKDATIKRDYVSYTVQDKTRFFYLKIEKCINAPAAAKQLDIHIRTAQRWIKQYNMRPDSIFDVSKQVGRKCVLNDERKMTVVKFIDANPFAAVVEATENLLNRFNNLKVSCSTVYNFMRSECNLSLKKADFHSIERNSPAKIEERHDWVRKWENTDMNFLTNCVFLDESAFDINMKRSRAWSKKVMDIAPIHTHENIKKYIEYRGYKCVYLPTYSPELNPIEQFWAVAKSKVKRHRFLQEDTLSKRITEACNSVEKGNSKGFVLHSYKCWEKCRNKEAM
ncbi:hypothetical protein G6F46_003981 [Rhizopus delemar]|uniref:Tc1-like transposase DDE domain-containing protein n=2 Tax=Rhizopus TaxID=4842 RepID=A0A9P6ZBL5_9FUNG|nr:hypothetical protein G6F55_004483 [Rhizopus delemar]KAG1552450.1 hypothetical protein G6F51_001225 [Rhizopus arrhizus]KAG1496772.1 hypothetical protein G6F54_006237 [Rhizopus delemar]KAG1518450.1 hypothetical protein G6F53_000589 [Rhizopus delemar]KAG1521390.1 hypothetical protein G6F52_006787 [Rhizopus delemar]